MFLVSFSMTILVERCGGEGVRREEWVGERVRERVVRRLRPRLLLRLREREREGLCEGEELREVLRGVAERVGERRPLGRSAMSVSAMMAGGAWGGVEDTAGWVERVANGSERMMHCHVSGGEVYCNRMASLLGSLR